MSTPAVVVSAVADRLALLFAVFAYAEAVSALALAMMSEPLTSPVTPTDTVFAS